MNKTDKTKKRLQIILYVLLILSILRSFIGRGFAEGIPNSAKDYFDECSVGSLTNLSSSDLEIYNAFLNTCFNQDYIFAYDFHYYSAIYHIFLFAPSSYIGVWGTYGTPKPLNLANNSTSNYPVYCVMLQTGGVQLLTFNNPGFNAYWDVLGWNKYSQSYSTDLQSGTSFQFGTTANGFDGNVRSNGGNFALIIYNRSTDYGYSASWQTVTAFPEDDNRFHARTYMNAFDQNVLEIKWDSSVYPTTGNMNYLKSILQLTIDINGASSVITFDSSEYPDLFPTSDSSYIPFTFLDSVGNIVSFSDLDSVALTKIKLTQYAYPSGSPSTSATAYSAQASYYLSLVDIVDLPVWDSPVISPAGGHIIDIATGNVYDNVSFSPPYGYSQQHFSDIQSVSWADVKIISESSLSSGDENALDNLFKDVANVVMSNWNYFYDKTFTDFNDVASYIQSDNQYADTYDIIIFYWNANSDLCWVTYTERYYIRLMYKQFGNFQTIMEGGFAYVSDIYNYMYDRFEPLNNNLISYFDSTLSNDSVLLRYVRSINGYCNSINTGIDRIIGSGGRSLSDIYDRLGSLSGGSGFILNDFMTAFQNKMNYLFVPSYNGLDDTFDTAIENLGILALPFVFSSDLITALKVPYCNTLDITFPSMSIPWHEEMEGCSVDSTLVLWDDYDVSFNPASVIPVEWLELFQYLNALIVLVSVTLLTYRHIFSRRASESEGTL